MRSFIDSFCDFHSQRSSPDIFVLWGALYCLSAATNRRVYAVMEERELYPNLFSMLIAPPGVGKSSVVDMIRKLLHKTFKDRPPTGLGSSNLTGARLGDELKNNRFHILPPESNGIPEKYHALHLAVSDLQTLFPSYNEDIVAKLTRFYDCDHYDEGRRGGDGKNTFDLERVYVTFLAGTTPSHLYNTLPASAWNEGFMSRFLFVYSDERKKRPLFGTSRKAHLDLLDLEMREHLNALRKDMDFEGEVRLSPEVSKLLEDMNDNNGVASIPGGMEIYPPTHPRLEHYLVRRLAHLLRLMTLSCLNRLDRSLTITEEDFGNALAWLYRCEQSMVSFLHSGMRGAADDLFAVIRYEVKRNENTMQRSRLREILNSKGYRQGEMDKAIDDMIDNHELGKRRDQTTQRVYYFVKD